MKQNLVAELQSLSPSSKRCQTCFLAPDVLAQVNQVRDAWHAGQLSHLSKAAVHRFLKSRIGYPFSVNSLFLHFDEVKRGKKEAE